MNVGIAIFNILTADANLAALVSDRIYPEMAPENVVAPFVVYSIRSVDPKDTKSASSGLDVSRVEFYVCGPDYANVQTINATVRLAIERQEGNFDGVAIQSVQYNDEDCDFDIDTRDYVSEMRFTFRVLRSGVAQDVGTVELLGVRIREESEGTTTVANTIVFPDDSVTTSANVATITFTGGGGGSVEIAQVSIGATTPTFGQLLTDIDMGTTDFDNSTNLSAYNNGIRVLGDGIVIFRVHIEVNNDSNHQLPNVQLWEDSARVKSEGFSYITGTHGDSYTSIDFFWSGNVTTNQTYTIKAINAAAAGTLTVSRGWMLAQFV